MDWIASLVMILVAGPAAIRSDANDEEERVPAEVDFNAHIRPIFTAHCSACHGGVMQAGDVSFAYRDQVLPPGGWIVEPGDPDSSILMERVLSDDPDICMPPPEHGPPLSPHDTERLATWIRQGAPWSNHWAFEGPKRPPIPDVEDPSWPLRPMDQYVLEKLDDEGIEPSPDADPERWLRRVTLDLTGLPPTIDQQDCFLAELTGTESSPAHQERAYADVVDGLLDSPAYGERWASVWLDQVRYADSKGLGLDGRRNIWKYRDWVITALNRDLPYDQFTIKQIAGDLLPEAKLEDQIATAAHRLTQSNEEGGTDDEEFRIAAVLDRVNTTWQTWQGVTFGCVQCHSHPYDPFRHEEYYQFAAFFNNTADCDLNEEWPTIQVPLDVAQYDEAAVLDQQIQSLRRQIWDREFELLLDDSPWTPLLNLQATSSNATQLAVERKDGHDEFYTVGTISRDADITLDAPLPGDMQQLTAFRITVMPLEPESAISDSEWGFSLSHVEAHLMVPGEDSPRPIELKRVIIDEPDPFVDPQASLNAKSWQGFSAYTRLHHSRQAAFLPADPVEIPPESRLRVTLKHRRYILSAFALIAKRGYLDVSDDARLSELLSDADVSSQRERLDQLQQRRSRIPSTSVPILRERSDHLSRPTNVFIRGLFLTKDQRVMPGTPASLPPLPDDLPADRRGMAQWLVSSDNPLTARVHVNRIWSRLFGSGLVATEEDFGSSGEAPSHPDLLDYLAVTYQDDYRWSTKRLLREIVLSRTYRQSAMIRSSLLDRDPANRLLARGPRHRLSAEIVRDQSLALAGLLSERSFGPPVHPPIPSGVWNPFQGSDRWQTPQEGGEDRYRRSVYTYTKRSIPYPMFAAFDSPSREFCSPRRLRSNTPLQALMTLNDPTFIESAQGLAARMHDSSDDVSARIRYGLRLVTCRQPNDAEVRELMTMTQQFDNTDSMQQLVNVASVLLNLDEVLMK